MRAAQIYWGSWGAGEGTEPSVPQTEPREKNKYFAASRGKQLRSTAVI